jgi:Helix-turn-helix domain
MDAATLWGVPTTPLLTVEEAAAVLRIGRSLAYQLAREYEASGGVSGLPVIRIGGCLRVPRWALLELACCGRVVRLCDAVVPAEYSEAIADVA